MKKILIFLAIMLTPFLLTSCREREKVCSLTSENVKAYIDFEIDFIGVDSWGTGEDLKWTEFQYVFCCMPYEDKYVFQDCIIVVNIINGMPSIVTEVRVYLDSSGYARVLTNTLKTGTTPYSETDLKKHATYKIVAITGNIYKM